MMNSIKQQLMNLFKKQSDLTTILLFAAGVLTMPIWLDPIGANYPDLLQKFVIFGIFAVGYNILFGLTGYLSFGHAVFLGVGSYTAVWSFKLFTMNVLPAMLFATLISGLIAAAIGFVSMRRSGIYFSILTLAFAQMFYNLAYSVLIPITNGETGLQLRMHDIRIIDNYFSDPAPGLPSTELFGMSMNGYSGFYFCAVVLILAFYVAMKIFRSPFGLKLKAIKSNQHRMRYTGSDTRPYLITAFIISGMFAGLAGALLAVTDPLAGAERMQWTASGEVILMTILGGVGTLFGPLLGVGIIKYLENIFSTINESVLQQFFSFLPQWGENFMVAIVSPFVGDGWHLTLGILFMIIIIFLPGGLMEGFQKIKKRYLTKGVKDSESTTKQE
jgi:ABC-type branched-subunit amino acid transport system permease subunit